MRFRMKTSPNRPPRPRSDPVSTLRQSPSPRGLKMLRNSIRATSHGASRAIDDCGARARASQRAKRTNLDNPHFRFSECLSVRAWARRSCGRAIHGAGAGEADGDPRSARLAPRASLAIVHPEARSPPIRGPPSIYTVPVPRPEERERNAAALGSYTGGRRCSRGTSAADT